MEEIWKDIEGWEGYYQVSNMGNVKSLNYRRTGKEGILKPKKDKDGYLVVCFNNDNKIKYYLVHQLVAQAFIDNPENYNEVNHKDENKQNNCVDNLEWCNRAYNINYGTRNQKISKPVVGINKVSGLILEFESVHEAERQLGIAPCNICACLKGRQNSSGGFYWYYADEDDDTE